MKKLFICVFFSFLLINSFFCKSSILKIGHRGACGYEPENTLQSFKKAIELGVDAIEFDVRLCKSKKLVVIHDARLNRTTNGNGKVKDFFLKDIKKLNAGNGQKVPSFIQALNIIGKKAKILIELKEKETAKPVVEIIEQFVEKKGWKYSDFVVISFNKEALFDVRTLNSNIRLGASFDCVWDLEMFFEKYDKNALSFKKNFKNIYYIGINYMCLDLKLLNLLHKKGFFVFVFTVNNVEEIERLRKLGVDGIVSDYPDRI
jgi:glycerophosphoryl diester phosphodiesterase